MLGFLEHVQPPVLKQSNPDFNLADVQQDAICGASPLLGTIFMPNSDVHSLK